MSEASTAWMLMSTALGFFYGGLVRSKGALNTMMMSVAAIGFFCLSRALHSYSLAFADFWACSA